MIEAPLSDVLTRCRRIGTATWSDALDSLGIDGVIDGLTIRSGADISAAGVAVTAKQRVHDLDREDSSGFDIAGILAALHPGAVLAIDTGGVAVSTFGGLGAMSAERSGATGVVVDGACRDLSDILRTNLWVASRHVTPRSGKGRITVESINEPIQIAGVPIAPGDIIIGDSTGVVRIPRARLVDVLPVAESLAHRDAQFAALLHTRSFKDAARDLGPV